MQYSQTPPVSCRLDSTLSLCMRLTEKKPERWSTSRQIPPPPFGILWTCSRSSDANPNSDPNSTPRTSGRSCRLSHPRGSRALLSKDGQLRCVVKLKGYLDQLCASSPPDPQRVQGIGVSGWVVERVKSSSILVDKVWPGRHEENSEKYPEAREPFKRLWGRT